MINFIGWFIGLVILILGVALIKYVILPLLQSSNQGDNLQGSL